MSNSSTAVVASALFFVAPLFSLVLSGILFYTRGAGYLNGRRNKHVAWAMVAALAVASTLIGGLSLRPQTTAWNRKAAGILQALIGVLVGIPVLHLCASLKTSKVSFNLGFKNASLLDAVYSGILIVILSSAAFLSLLPPFLHSPRSTFVIGPALFIAYTILSLPRAFLSLLVPRHPPTFPQIQRGTSPAYNADFGFDATAFMSGAPPATLRAFRFPPAASQKPSVFPSFIPPIPPAPLSKPPRLPTIPSIPSQTSSTCTHSPATPTWLGSLSSLRSQVSLGALRNKQGAPGTTRRPITIHVATHRTSWAHDAGASLEAEKGRASVSEDSHGPEDSDIGLPQIIYPPPPQESRRASIASTSGTGNHMIDLKTLAVSPLTPVESDVEVEFQERKYHEHLSVDLDAVTTHIALPTIGTNLGSRFSIGDDSLHMRDDGRARSRRIYLLVLAAQIMSGAAWTSTLAGAIPVASNSEQIVVVVQAACTMLAVTGTMAAYFIRADTNHHTTNMQLTSIRRQGGGRRSDPFGKKSHTANVTNSTAGVTSEGTVTMDMAFHSAHPASALTYDNKGNTNPAPCEHTSNDYTRIFAVPRTPARATAAKVHDASSPPPHTRRRRDASLEGEIPRTLARSASVATHISSSAGSHAYDALLGSYSLTCVPILDANEAEQHGRDQDAWDTSVEGDMSLETMYSSELVPADEEGDRETAAAQVLLAPAIDHFENAPRTRIAHTNPMRHSTASFENHGHNRIGSNGRNGGQSRHRKHVTDDPSACIRKRGSAPPAITGRRFFGWDFTKDTNTEEARSKAVRQSVGEVSLQADSFMDLRGRGVTGPKAKRQSLLSSIVSLGSGGARTDVAHFDPGRSSSVPRKLQKRSMSRLRGESKTAEITDSPPLPQWTRDEKADAVPSIAPESPSALAFCLGRLGSSKRRSWSSGSTPRARGGLDDTVQTRSQEATPRALQLKKSFKLGVGRTMGPGLTLAVAEQPVKKEELTPAMRERQRYYNAEKAKAAQAATVAREARLREEEGVQGLVMQSEGSYSTSEGGEDDGEARSIAAARLVSASIARATHAATIVTAPSTPLRSTYRVSYPSAYNVTPTQEKAAGPMMYQGIAVVDSEKTPGTPTTTRASWKPHPFADGKEEEETVSSPIRATSKTEEAHVVHEDRDEDLVKLEHAMEEMNGQDGADSEKALRALDATDADIAPAEPQAPPEKPTHQVVAATGKLKKRLTLSTPPVPKSDWVPQAVSTANGGFAYRFPMIFGPSMSASSSSRSSSPPQSMVGAQFTTARASPTPGTPRSSATTRLPARTMDTVRSAFAGVGARMSNATSRMSVTSTVGTPTRSARGQAFNDSMISENGDDGDGDFMDLRDPFAPPPPSTTALPTSAKKAVKGGARQWDNFLVIEAYEPEEADAGPAKGSRTRRRRMSAWGRLPIPVRTLSPVPSSGGASTATVTATGAATAASRKSIKSTQRLSRGKGGVRKAKKEKRTRKVTLPSVASALAAAKAVATRSGEEDGDFGLEEALLSQKLLRRLNSAEWDGRV